MIVIDQQLTKLRKKNNMSQEKLAELLGVSRQTIYKWENNKAYPDMINLVTLSDIFDISMEELIKGVQKDNLDESKTACNQTLNQIKTRKTYIYRIGISWSIIIWNFISWIFGDRLIISSYYSKWILWDRSNFY